MLSAPVPASGKILNFWNPVNPVQIRPLIPQATMHTLTMKIAAPSEQDLETVLTLNSLLSDLDECNRPFGSHSFIRDTDGEWNPEDPEHFDPDNGDHCKVFVARILKLLDQNPSCTNRVIWGFHTAWSNNVFDKESDHLALHPDLVAAQAKAAQTDTASITPSA